MCVNSTDRTKDGVLINLGKSIVRLFEEPTNISDANLRKLTNYVLDLYKNPCTLPARWVFAKDGQ